VDPPPPIPDWLGNQLPFARSSVDVGGWRMHVMSAGDGPAVLLLHGNPTWGFLWRRVAAALGDHRLRLVIPDLVGLGLSDKPRDARLHTIDGHALWLERLVEALALDRLVFVGHDWGGPIGLRMLANRPERTAGLVLLNTVAGPPRQSEDGRIASRPTAFHRFANLPLLSTLAFRLLGLPQRALHLVQGDRRSIRGVVARAYRWPLRGLRNNVAPLALARLVPTTHEHPSMEPLRRVQAFVEGFAGPAAIVWGERDPVLARALSRVSRLLPQAPVTRTPGGHFLQEEVPEAIAAAVLSVADQAFA
jgi:haloalkane dehalogenase